MWTHVEKELEKFISSFNSFTPNLKFTYDSSKKDNILRSQSFIG